MSVQTNVVITMCAENFMMGLWPAAECQNCEQTGTLPESRTHCMQSFENYTPHPSKFPHTYIHAQANSAIVGRNESWVKDKRIYEPEVGRVGGRMINKAVVHCEVKVVK